MEIKEIRILRDRNIYCHRPVINLLLDPGQLMEKSTKEYQGFNEGLLKLFPGLKRHCCSLGYEGGFVTRLTEGTYICHVTEHLILELQTMLGFDVFFGKTRLVQEPSLYSIIYEYVNKHCGVECGRYAVQIVTGLVHKENIPIKSIMDKLRKIAGDTALGPSTKGIYDEAKKRGIPVTRLGDESLLQLGYGKNLHLIQASLPDGTSSISVDMAKNKQLTKQRLSQYGIPIPDGGLVYTIESAVALANELGYPVVLKPFDGNQGKGITLNIGHEKQLRTAYQLAVKYSNALIVEKFIKGRDYRVLVVGDKVSAVAERTPPSVTGDGVHTIKELVAKENRSSQRGIGHEKPLTKIRLDRVAQQLLKRYGLSVDHVPDQGKIIYLRENSNLSTGGTARDCTGEIHPDNARLAGEIAKITGLEIVGIDLVMDDISQPLTPENGAVVEVNAGPGLRMHLYPTEGQARNVAADIIDFLYPEGSFFTIPIISITGTNGKTTVTRLIKHMFTLLGKTVGMTCTGGTYIGNRCISQGDNTGAASAELVLSNKEVEVAVLETARGGIVRRGLGYNLADVGVIVNLSEDHLGQDGIESLEELAYVKALVVEAVKPEGYAVLNADDPMTNFFRERVRCQIVYFSRIKDNPLVINHIKEGKRAVTIEDKILFIYQDGRKTPVIGVNEIPITFDGLAQCNMENVLAAVASLITFHIPVNVISMGLMSFKPDFSLNPGRFNIFNLGNCQVMLDYGHNISGYNSVFQLVRNVKKGRLVGIIGMPGDRLDRDITEVGKISGEFFSKIYIKEDEKLRGRLPGQVAQLLYQGVIEGGAKKDSVEIMISELEALRVAVNNALPGDFIIMFYEKFAPAFDFINKLLRERRTMAGETLKVEPPMLPLYEKVLSGSLT